MSKIDDLIQEFCPDGVEYKPIKKLAEVGTGSSNGNEAQEDGKYPFFIRSQTVKRKNEWEYDEEAIIIPGEGGIGEIYHYVNGKYAIHQRVYRIHFTDNSVDVKFAYHYFRAFFKNFIMRKAVSATVKSIRKPMIEEFMLPVPPLEVQREIVHILDNFTELTAELTAKLTAEFTARKKQYEFYRNKLLTFESDISCVPLKDVAIIERGTRVVRNQLSDSGEYPVYQNALTPMGYYEDFNRNANNTFMICAGAAGQIGFSVVDFWAADDCYTFKCNENIDNKYLFHVLKNNQYKIDSKVRKASIPRISRESVGNILVPVPELKVQKRIVNVLDNFESICTDLNIGLPAEIEARQKQYEYYRDLLLTFAAEGATILTDRQTDRQAIIRLLQYVFGYVSIELGAIATVTKLAGYEFTKYVTYSNEGKIIALRGLNVKNGNLDLTDVKYIDKSDLSKLNRSKLCSGDMLFTYVGTIGQVAVVNENDKYYLAPNVALIRADTQFVNPEYMRYFFQTNVFWDTQINRLLQFSSMKNIPMEKIRKFILQLPSIEEQERIVSILDRFDTLCNDLSAGLPAEIEARKKQYEYYRDKLLSFKELPK